jgi:hypothetical protein
LDITDPTALFMASQKEIKSTPKVGKLWAWNWLNRHNEKNIQEPYLSGTILLDGEAQVEPVQSDSEENEVIDIATYESDGSSEEELGHSEEEYIPHCLCSRK